MKKILYLILHGEVYRERVFNVKNTWGKNEDCIFYSDYQDYSNNIFKVCEDKTYHSNEKKFCSIPKSLDERYLDYDWYFFVDDDTFINTTLAKSFVNTLNDDEVYGEILNTWTPDPTLYYLSGGAGILIPKKIFLHLRENLENYKTGYSDVSLGFYFRKFNIKFNNSGLFKSQNPSFYNINEKNIKDYISFHYVKTYDEMKIFNNICNS